MPPRHKRPHDRDYAISRRSRERVRTFHGPEALHEQLAILRDARQTLNDYAASVNGTFGVLGWSIHDILWGTQRRRSALGPEAERWSEILLPHAAALSLAHYDEIGRTTATFSKALREVRAYGNLTHHPFWGSWPRPRTPAGQEAIGSTLAALNEAVVRAQAKLAAVGREVGTALPASETELAHWAAVAGNLAPWAHSPLVPSRESLGN